jgi:hypothetical protein
MKKKKRFIIRLLTLLLPACSVDTPVGEAVHLDDRLGEDLRPWCESACDKFISCGINGEEHCPEACVSNFTSWFIGKGEICAASALSLMDCIDTVSCSQLDDGACDSAEERGRCAASHGQVLCTSGGSGEIGGAGGNMASCDVYYDLCSDGHDYSVSCTGSDPNECECSIDNAPRGRFRFGREGCPDMFEAREICSWPIVPLPDEPPTRPVPCNAESISGAAGGGTVGGCEIEFADCSNGSTYGIICEAATNMCSCRVDGEQVGALIASDFVCPYLADPYSTYAATNAACDFTLTHGQGASETE